MVSLISLFTLLLRLTLAIQSQLTVVYPADFIEGSTSLNSTTPDQKVHPIFNSESGNQNGLIESEKEEKTETESEVSSGLFDPNPNSQASFIGRFYYDPFFGNKALLGNHHLYDLFQAWKTPLS